MLLTATCSPCPWPIVSYSHTLNTSTCCTLLYDVQYKYTEWTRRIDQSLWATGIVDKSERTMHRGQKLNGHFRTEQLCRRAVENRGVA